MCNVYAVLSNVAMRTKMIDNSLYNSNKCEIFSLLLEYKTYNTHSNQRLRTKENNSIAPGHMCLVAYKQY